MLSSKSIFKTIGHFKSIARATTAVRTLPENAIVEKTINNVVLLGRVGTEPMKKGTESHPMVTFSLATHNNFKHESGEYAQKTDWHKIVIFKPSLRELVFTNLKKGQRIHVSGRISYGSIKEDSIYRPTASIIAEEIIFFQHIDRDNYEK